jgi:tRNA(fMet)-specific endonuclease VapC
MLDTNIVSHMIRYPDGSAVRQAASVGEKSLCVSALVVSELRYGAAKRGSERLSALIESILERLIVIPYDDVVSHKYAAIRNELTRNGNLIGPVDLFIAAHALVLDLTLVTDNVREFSRVNGLAVENWLAQER